MIKTGVASLLVFSASFAAAYYVPIGGAPEPGGGAGAGRERGVDADRSPASAAPGKGAGGARRRPTQDALRELSARLEADEATRGFGRVLDLRYGLKRARASQSEVAVEFGKLFADRKKGIATVRAGLKAVPRQGFPMERISLLEAAAQLAQSPETREEARSIALDELTETVIPARPRASDAKTEAELDAALTTTVDMAIPQLAQGILLSIAESPSQALDDTVVGIQAQPDAFVQTRLASNFVESFPDQRSALEAALSSRGLTVAIQTEPQESFE